MEQTFQAEINYLARRGLYRHIRRACDEATTRNGSSPLYSFWKGFSLAMENETSEAVFLFEQLTGGTMSYCGWAGLLLLHTRSGASSSSDKVEECKAHLVVDLDNSPPDALAACASMQLWTGDHRGAKQTIKALKKMGHPQVGALRGWWELLSGHPRADFLEEISAQARPAGGKGTRNLEATLAEAKYFQMRGAHKEAVEVYNQCIVHFPGFVPALVEKAQAFVLMGDWSQASEAAQRVLGEDPGSIPATLIVAEHTLAVEADHRQAIDQCRTLLELVRDLEPRSAALLRTVSQPLARLASRNKDVLAVTMEMVTEAISLDPTDALAHCELGYQRFLTGDHKAASRSYAEAARLDEGLAPALYGTIRCQLAAGQVEDAAQQIEFLVQIQAGQEPAPMVSLLHAELSAHRREGTQSVVAHLDAAASAHIALARKGGQTDADSITAADPEFAMDMARMYVSQVSLDPSEATALSAPSSSAGQYTPGAITSRVCDLLQWLTKLAPGLVPPRLLLGRCMYALGRKDEGLSMINSCSSIDETNPGVHIALAQIYVSQGATGPAMSSLEMALAHDFSVREMPLYALVSAEAMESKGNLSEAARVLESSLNTAAVRTGVDKSSGADVPLRVRVSVYIACARVLGKLGRTLEASKVMADAMREFKGTPEEVRVTIANCEVALGKGDVNQALETLAAVPQGDPYFVKAKTTAARIHLDHRGDRKMFMKVYTELMRAVPTVPTLTLAAEAFMDISEPTKAIKAYELALKVSPNDPDLASRIGGVLVTMHDYRAAVDYYESAVAAAPNKLVLRRDLAELRLRLREHQQAQRVLIDALKGAKQEAARSPTGELDVTDASHEVAMLSLLSDVTGGLGKTQAVGDLLGKAISKQEELVARCRREKPEIVDGMRSAHAKLAIKLAKFREQERETEEAIKGFEEAQRIAMDVPDGMPLYTEATMALARLHLSRGALDLCQAQCLELLRQDPGSEEATMLLADVMFQRAEHATATYHFEALLQRRPSHFGALARLMVLLGRAGNLIERAPALLAQAEHGSPRASIDPGFKYCKGIYLLAKSDPLGALREFNLARRDPAWSVKALTHMINIYLCPDDQDLWEEAEEGAKDHKERIASARRLLDDYPEKQSPRYMWLHGQILLASRDRASIDAATEVFTELVRVDRDSVPGLLGLAVASGLTKQSAKAKNFLKRLVKVPFDPEWAEELERAHIMLGDVYYDAGKLDQALAAIKTALSYNASSAKAWAGRGRIEEKDCAYADAAESYERAWALDSERSAIVGFKLAFNFLKAKRWVDAINVCHKVLKIDPQYPKIRKEILDKARANIRQ